ncbi:MAG: hybrid sensor histidine kinase/response regulator, partial [Myxococcales bacterium]
GQGITPDFLPHVFERFRQADATITRTHGGLGLGLAIARHLVELQGGSIGVESAGADRGTTFFVRLPCEAGVEPPSVARPSSRLSHGREPAPLTALAGLTLLVVEDEEDSRTLLETLLESHGAVVMTATTASEGLAILRARRPDILVSDIGMMGTSGYDLIRHVRELDPAEGGTTPAIALTAYARQEDRTRALESGFDQHVSKPIAVAELVAALVSLGRRLGPARA